jgi:hypothetical protein
VAWKQGPLIFTGQEPTEDRRIQREAAAGRLSKVAEGLYVDAPGRPVEEVVCGAWAPILAHYAPGSILTGKSALRKSIWRDRGPDGRAVFPGWVWATDPSGAARKRFSLPGMEIRTAPGPGPLEGDIPFLGVFLPSDARCFLENLMPSRSRQGPSRTAGQAVVEAEIEGLLKTAHEDGLHELRARAVRIAPTLGAEAELATLQDIIGSILGTRQAKLVSAAVVARRRAKHPFDHDCMERLKLLATGLGRFALPNRPDPHRDADVRACTGFIEAYFTNYIEGTRFLVEKARRIVFEHDDPDGRPEDGRDVTQTFAQIAALGPETVVAASVDDFIVEICERNRQLLDARPDKHPGKFKDEPNAAGNTTFVMPDLVEGTLREGFATLTGIEHPFARGLFMHALIALVHPFNDGNGRTARIMMTKELIVGGQSRAIVPTIYRTDYLGGLRALSNQAPRVAPFISAMIRCQDVTSKIVSPNLDETISIWASTHAFLEDERGARLTDPNPSVEIEWRGGLPAPKSYWTSVDLEAQIDDVDDLPPAFRTGL